MICPCEGMMLSEIKLPLCWSKHLNIGNFYLIVVLDNSLMCHFFRGLCISMAESRFRSGKADICEHGNILMFARLHIPNLHLLTVCSIKLYQYLLMALSTHVHSNKLMSPSQLTHLAVKASSLANVIAGSTDLSKKHIFTVISQKEQYALPHPT